MSENKFLDHLIEVKESNIHGKGCYAKAPIAADAFIVEYTGEIIDRKMAVERDNPLSPDFSYYILEACENVYIDALKFEQPGKYINHSCAPNCILANDGPRAFVVALRNIAPGEELTYDYDYDDDQEAVCLCGAETCRGFI